MQSNVEASDQPEADSQRIPALDAVFGEYSRDAAAPHVKDADAKRLQIVESFPLDGWPAMPVERYALGQETAGGSYCWWLEYNSQELGSIKGGSARKMLIFKRRNTDSWYFETKKYASLEDAWAKVRGAFVEAFTLARQRNFDAIDALDPIRNGPTLRLKALYIYFPDDFLPIYSRPHIEHFLNLLGRSQEAKTIGWDVVRLNRTLLGALRQDSRVKGWSTREIMGFLYQFFHPGSKAPANPPPPQDPLFEEIGDALKRKGQVILYGPPGTGKTYTARWFAVWWLLQQGGQDATAIFANATDFDRQEQALSTVQLNRRVWWIVANPSEWRWDQLFADGHVEYRYGRLQKNYPLAQEGDLVIGYQSTPDKRIMALARIAKPFGPGTDGKLCLTLEPLVKVPKGVTYDEMLQDPILVQSEPLRFRNQGTLFALTTDEADHALTLLNENNPSVGPYVEPKTDDVGQLTRLTFHPSYSYEDFIEGFRPVDTGSGTLSLRLEDGVFKRVCRHAQAHPDKSYLVMIDEINRANIAKVFGEIITLLEKDKRGMIVTLPQSKESFAIPPNVYMLGTMNTADRSIKLLDAALRRRFAFQEMMPDVDMLQGAVVAGLPLDGFLSELNRRIAREEGREKQIGHSFLLDNGQPIETAEEFGRRFRQEILPLLQEYCYDDYAELAKYIGKELIDEESQTMDEEILYNPARLIDVLVKELLAGIPDQ